MLGDEVQANNLVYNQLQDLIQTQQRVLATVRETMIIKERELIPKEQYEEVVNDLENERLQHAKTQALLNQESEKLQYALGEIDILTNQMQREKKSFEKVLASIKNKALKESTKNDKLKSKCNEMEFTVQKHEDILIKKENQIKQLHNQLAKHKTTLKLQLTDVEIQRKQEAYIAEALQKKQRTAGHWTSGSSSYDTAV